MKKCVNGKYIEMTEAEIAEQEAKRKEMAEELKNLPPNKDERLEAVEMAILELAEVLANG